LNHRDCFFPPWEAKINRIHRWKEAEVIGNGSYGRVVMGLDLQTGSIMAVKQVQLGNMDSAIQQEVI